jgi:hypothetical protein
MDFTGVQDGDSMHELAMEVANDFREKARELYQGMYERNAELEGTMPNVVLAGMTLLWLESVERVHGTMDYETALSLVKEIRPSEKGIARHMRLVARDFLRRSRWLPKMRRR